MLLEFIKVDESELLKKREEEREEKDKLTKDVIEAIGTEIVDQPEWKTEESTIKNLPCLIPILPSMMTMLFGVMSRWKVVDC